jgi:predicted nucleic acid-binding protein
MILCDANLLLYAYNVNSAYHTRAKEWLEGELSSPSLFCLSWQTITAFIRISTNHRAFPRPLTIEQTVKIVSSWLDRPQRRVLAETERLRRPVSLVTSEPYRLTRKMGNSIR